MADLRIVFDIKGFPPIIGVTGAYGTTITFDSTQSGDSAAAAARLAVTMTADGQFDLCQDANTVVGQLTHVQKNGQCSVQIAGGVVFPAGNAATVTAGSKIVGALGAASAKGFIRNANSAVAAETLAGRHLIMSAADATAVQVFLS